MRYLLSPAEERRMLLQMKAKYGLVPLSPLDTDDFPGELEVLQRWSPNAGVPKQISEYIFWASKSGPIRYLNERAKPETAAGQVMRKLNMEAGLGEAVDLETTPIVTWTRPFWFDGDQRWIVPSRLGSTRSIFKNLPVDYRKMYRSIEKSLKKNGKLMNSWDIPNSHEGMGQKFERPNNSRNFMVIVWQEATKLLSQGVKIYHWDG